MCITVPEFTAKSEQSVSVERLRQPYSADLGTCNVAREGWTSMTRSALNMDKSVATPAAAVADIADGASIAVGGFGLCGVPVELIAALYASGTTDLRTVSNNCGVDGWGLGSLLDAKRISRTTGSYVGE